MIFKNVKTFNILWYTNNIQNFIKCWYYDMIFKIVKKLIFYDMILKNVKQKWYDIQCFYFLFKFFNLFIIRLYFLDFEHFMTQYANMMKNITRFRDNFVTMTTTTTTHIPSFQYIKVISDKSSGSGYWRIHRIPPWILI